MIDLFKKYYEIYCDKKTNDIKKNKRADGFLKFFCFCVLLIFLFMIFLPSLYFSLIPFVFSIASIVDYSQSFKKEESSKDYFKNKIRNKKKNFRYRETKFIEMEKIFNNEKNLAKVYKEKEKLTKAEMKFFIEEYKKLPKENIETIIERRFVEVEKNSINIINE